MLKKLLQYGFLAALISGGIFLWRQALPCQKPIEYSLGTFDARFGISQEAFLKEVATAERSWEGVLGRELFHSVPGAAFKLNLIFDERQEQTLAADKLEASLEKTNTTQETLEQQQAKTLASYEKVSQEYERMLSSFKKRLFAYNAEVEKWNERGGAPKEEYEKLQDISETLEKNRQELELKRQEVNRLAGQVNAFSKQKVALVNEYNEQVDEFVDRYGEGGEFDQGEYVVEEINIYQYDDLPHLRAVLVHEFGHALGLGHGTNPRSIMYHLMKDQKIDPVTLTAEDEEMVMAQCNQGIWDIMFQKLMLLKGRVLSASESL